MIPSNPPREADLPTSWSEERPRTIDGIAAGRTRPAPGPVPGAVLKNRFVLLECLADGPASQLFCARDQRREENGEADARVALKIVTAAAGSEPRALLALRREAAIALGLDHPNLPRILGIDHDGPHNFLCMEWLQGESLATILDSRGTRPMTRVQALHIVDGVCRALTHLHSQRITHADVKPGNILVSPQGNATLLDFGVAVGPGASDLPAVRGYTAEYASPEVLGGAEPTPLDDIFSLACVAYRMLSGFRAFGVGTARDAEIAGLRPARPDSLSPIQWRALDRGLAFSRAGRQPDVTTFLAQLKGARDETTAVTDLSAGEPEATLLSAADFQPAQQSFWPVLAVLTGVLTIGTVYWYRNASPDQREGPAPPLAATATNGQGKPTAVARGNQVLPVRRSAPPTSPPTSRAAKPVDPPAVAKLPGREPRTVAATARPAPAERRGIQAASTKQEPRTGGTPGSAAGSLPDLTAPVSPLATLIGGAPVSSGRTLPETATTSNSVPFSSLTIRRYVEPDYPRSAATRRVSGWVDVTFNVDAAGRTREVRVINADPPGVFDDAARSAVRRWRFEAGEAAGPVSSGIRVRFDPGKGRRTR